MLHLLRILLIHVIGRGGYQALQKQRMTEDEKKHDREAELWQGILFLVLMGLLILFAYTNQ